jgi:hypothetical protein
MVLRKPRSRVEEAVRLQSSEGESIVTRRDAGPVQVSPMWAYPVWSQAAP